MISFAWVWNSLWLPLPWLMQRYWPPKKAHHTQAALRLPFFSTVQSLPHSTAGATRPPSQRVFYFLVWCLFILAAMRPQWVGDPIRLPTQGRDLLLAVDISGSMKTRDQQLDKRMVSRLTVVKTLTDRFITERTGDRVGLILFGSQAYLQTPLTFDRKTTKTFLNEAVVGLAGPQTAIGDAIGLAVKRLQHSKSATRTLILITDGANNVGAISPQQAAAIAASHSIRIYTIGVGATRLVVPSFWGSEVINPSAELDEATLKRIAALTKGRYFRAQNTSALAAIYRTIDTLEPSTHKSPVFRPKQALFFWPLGAALLLCALTISWQSWRRYREVQ